VLERFLQPDLSQSTGLFSYVYANDDPLDSTDPTGEAPWRNCGPDMIYCGGMPGGEVDQPTNVSAGTPCYYNPDDCAWSPSVGASPANDPGGFASATNSGISADTGADSVAAAVSALSPDITTSMIVNADPIIDPAFRRKQQPSGPVSCLTIFSSLGELPNPPGAVAWTRQVQVSGNIENHCATWAVGLSVSVTFKEACSLGNRVATGPGTLDRTALPPPVPGIISFSTDYTSGIDTAGCVDRRYENNTFVGWQSASFDVQAMVQAYGLDPDNPTGCISW
jgi:hypothetical protein